MGGPISVFQLVHDAATQEGAASDIASHTIARLTPVQRQAVARSLLASAIETERRRMVAMIERSAATSENRRWRRDREARNLEQFGEPNPDSSRMFRQAIEAFERDIRLELTNELLASEFALGDGTSVTWGTATAVHHRQRIDLLTIGAKGTMQTIALHGAALQMLEETGAICLGAINRTVAA